LGLGESIGDIDKAATSRDRQKESFNLLKKLIRQNYKFKDKAEAHDFFTRLTELYNNLNYSAEESPVYKRYIGDIEDLSQEFV
jgi:V/A-type H+/Na+-transporting ATPase subunit A